MVKPWPITPAGVVLHLALADLQAQAMVKVHQADLQATVDLAGLLPVLATAVVLHKEALVDLHLVALADLHLGNTAVDLQEALAVDLQEAPAAGVGHQDQVEGLAAGAGHHLAGHHQDQAMEVAHQLMEDHQVEASHPQDHRMVRLLGVHRAVELASKSRSS